MILPDDDDDVGEDEVLTMMMTMIFAVSVTVDGCCRLRQIWPLLVKKSKASTTATQTDMTPAMQTE